MVKTNTLSRNRFLIFLLAILLAGAGLTVSAFANQSVWLSFGSTSVDAASGPIPGCPAAEHVSFKGPWEGGPWYFPKWDSKRPPLKLAIAHVWSNLNADSIRNHPRNPGQPAWNQNQVKVKITPKIIHRLGGRWARLFAQGGEIWIYKNIKACRRNIDNEFKNGDLPIKRLGRLADDGLAYIY